MTRGFDRSFLNAYPEAPGATPFISVANFLNNYLKRCRQYGEISLSELAGGWRIINTPGQLLTDSLLRFLEFHHHGNSFGLGTFSSALALWTSTIGRSGGICGRGRRHRPTIRARPVAPTRRDTILSWELSSKTRIFLAELLCFAE